MDTNGYAAQQAAARAKVYLQPSATFKIQVYICSALLGICLLLTLGALLFRFRAGSLWLFKLQPTDHERIPSPHPMVLWLICSGAYVVLALVNAHKSILATRVGEDLTNSVAWRTFLWLALWLGAWSVAWATTLASVLPRPSHPLARRPLLLTAIFVLTPVIVLGILVPLDLVANSHFNATFGAFRALDAELSRAVAAISSGAAYDPSPLAQLVESLASRRSESITAWRRAWIGLCALTLSMLVVFTSAAVSHFKSLGKQMSQLKARVATGDSYSKEHRQLRWAFRTLAFTVSTLWLNAVSYIALVLIISIKTQKLVDGTRFGETTTLVGLWIFSILGTMTNAVLFLRSLPPSTVSPTSRPHHVTAISSHVQDQKQRGSAAGEVQVTREVRTTFEMDAEREKTWDRFDVELEPVEKAWRRP